MPLPPVKVQIVAGGVSGVLDALKTIEKAQEKAAKEAAKKQEDSIRYMNKVRERSATMAGQYAMKQADAEIREAKKVQKEQERALQSADREREKVTNNAIRLAEKQANAEIRAKQRAQKEGERLANQQLNDERRQSQQRTNLFANSMQQLGLNNIARGTRLAAQFNSVLGGKGGSSTASGGAGGGGGGSGITSLLGGAAGGGEGGGIGAALGEAGGLAAISGEAIVATAGIAAIAVAAIAGAYAIKKGFDVLIEGIQFGVNEFSSAILEIGGGFKVSAALVQGERNKRDANSIAAGSFGEISGPQVQDMIKRVSAGSQFTRQEHTAAFRSWKGRLGRYGTMEGFEQNNQFLQEAALINNTPLERVTDMYAAIKNRNPKASDKEVQGMFKSISGAAAAGALDVTDLPQIQKVLGYTGLMEGGQNNKNVGLVMSHLSQLTGAGATPSQADTELRSLYGAMKTFGGQKPGEAAKFGIHLNKHGELTNPDKAIEDLIRAQHGGRVLPKIFNEKNRMLALAQMKLSAGIEDKDDDATVAKKLDANKKRFIVQTSDEQWSRSMGELNDSTGETKIAFNRLKDTIQDTLVPQMEKMVSGPLNKFVDWFITQGPQLEKYGKIVVDTVEVLGGILQALQPLLEMFSVAILKTASGITSIATGLVAMAEKTAPFFPGLFGDLKPLSDSLSKLTADLNGLADGIGKPAKKPDAAPSWGTNAPSFLGWAPGADTDPGPAGPPVPPGWKSKNYSPTAPSATIAPQALPELKTDEKQLNESSIKWGTNAAEAFNKSIRIPESDPNNTATNQSTKGNPVSR